MKRRNYRPHQRRWDYFLRYGVRRPILRTRANGIACPIHAVTWLNIDYREE